MLGLMMAFAATLPISVAGEPPVPAPPAGAVTLLGGPMRGTFEEMEAKVSALRRNRGVTMRTALVYSGELDPEVAASGYFNAIVDVEEVM